MVKRIGIFAGTFDPVHAGHIGFALQAMEQASLDRLYFLPERQPRGKSGVEHFGHRVGMLRRAVRPYRRFDVLELPDRQFSVKRSLPQLERQFPNARLVFLIGSDAAASLAMWPQIERLLDKHELVIGLREGAKPSDLHLPTQAKVTSIESSQPAVSSRQVREGLRQQQPTRGLLESVRRYARKHWLYVAFTRRKP